MENNKLKNSLINMGLEGMSEISHPAVIELINEFDPSPSKSTLAETLLNIYESKNFLEDNLKRERVLTHITEKDARDLLQLLSHKEDGNIWDQLMKIPFRGKNKEVFLGFFGIETVTTREEKVSSPEHSSSESIIGDYPLFPHQEKAASKVKQKLQDDLRARVLLHMPTGSGKTRTSMNVICDFLRNNRTSIDRPCLIVWLADTEELCDQAATEFKNAWKAIGIGEISLHRFYGSYDQDLSCLTSGLLVAGLAKLNKRIISDQSGILRLGSNTRLVVFDEAHKVLAPTYQQIVSIFQETSSSPLLGLSATPGRSTFDEHHNRAFADFFNRTKIVLEVEGYDNPIEYLQDQGYIAQVNYHELPYEPKDLTLAPTEVNALANGSEIPSSVLEKLGIDTKRNIKILSTTLEAVEKGRRIILFACSVKNAEALYCLLLYKNIQAGLVTANTPRQKRQEIIQKYKTGEVVILVNYGVFTTGFDAPKTNVAIIARPTNSLTLYSQMVGRAARGPKVGGNETCDIYTVTDTIPGFKNMAEAFRHWDDVWE